MMERYKGYWISGTALPGPPNTRYWESRRTVLIDGRLQSFFKPLLDFASNGKEHSIQDARDAVAKVMALSEADMKEMLPSGIQTRFDNRVA
jgi:hypothetical protein